MTHSDQDVLKANINVHKVEAPLYDTIHREIFNAYEQSLIVQELAQIKTLLGNHPYSILDVGCGTGNLTLKYLREGHRVTALDISEEMITILKAKVHAPQQLETVIQNVEDYLDELPPDTYFDLVSFSSVLHHLPSYLRVLEKVCQHLKPNGIIYVIHEPTLIPPCVVSARSRLLGRVDLLYHFSWRAYAYLRHFFQTGTLITHIDYSISDIHARRGLDMTSVIQHLQENQMQVILNEQHWVTSLAWVARQINETEPCSGRHLRLIAQKTESMVKSPQLG